MLSRVRRLEATARSAAPVFATMSEHDAGQPEAVLVQGQGRMDEAEFHRRYPGGLLVVLTCWCEDCRNRHDTTEG